MSIFRKIFRKNTGRQERKDQKPAAPRETPAAFTARWDTAVQDLMETNERLFMQLVFPGDIRFTPAV